MVSKTEERKIFERFGGDTLLDASMSVGIGDLNTDGGWAPVPWRFSRYTGALRLGMVESRLGLEYLKHQWEWDGETWLSLDKLALFWGCSEKTLRVARTGLRDKGYLAPVSYYYKLRKYTICSLLVATAICVSCDTDSNYAKEHGPLSIGDANILARRYGFDLDLVRMQLINEHYSQKSER